ncbi:IclR family transcriptional regulator [Arthrobacter sp. SF27]|nr:IclR family transcriptional regulator [Arthrobacter sp. SF27]NMR30527.1 IclR family transcriptional regulator [Arthrobacter sp. SF27]
MLKSKEVADKSGGTTIQSVSRALKMLLAVAQSSNGLLAKEAAERFGLSVPTAYHLLNTMAREGMLFKDTAKKYHLGPAAAVIAQSVAATDVVPEHFSLVLRDLARTTGETAYLSAWSHQQIRVLETIEGAHAVRVGNLAVGYADHLHSRASGKVLLAFAPEDFRAAVLDSLSFDRLTPNTITSRKAFTEELQRVAEEGVAYDNQEFALGVDCIAAPIWVSGSVIGAFTVSVPSPRFVETKTEVLEAVKAAALKAGTLG